MAKVLSERAGSFLVTTEDRGRALRQRRLTHGIKSVRELRQATGVSREAITAAEAGTASDATYERLEAWFDRFEEETGSEHGAVLASADEFVEYRVAGGEVSVVVKGPVSDLPALEASVMRLLKQMRGDD